MSKKSKNIIINDEINLEVKTDDEFQEELIEAEEEFKDLVEEELTEKEQLDLNFYELNTNKHRREGKHSLKRDTILKGKVQKVEEEDDTEKMKYNSVDKIDSASIYEFEYRSNEEYTHQKGLSNDIYAILRDDIKLNFNINRKKPKKETFNKYYEVIIQKIGKKYTKSEIFVELAYYFTDSIFNCFKLLNKDYSLDIIKELKDKGFLKEIDNLNFT